MSFFSAKILAFPTLLGWLGVSLAIPNFKEKCKIVLRYRITCYKLFASAKEGEYIVCPSKGDETNPNFYLRWTKDKPSRSTFTKTGKITTQMQSDKKSVQVKFTELNKEMKVSIGYFDIFGTDKDNLEKLHSIDLQTSCTIKNKEKSNPELDCGSYQQELKYSQKYLI